MLRTPQPLGIARMLVERQKPLKSGPRPLLVLARRVEQHVGSAVAPIPQGEGMEDVHALLDAYVAVHLGTVRGGQRADERKQAHALVVGPVVRVRAGDDHAPARAQLALHLGKGVAAAQRGGDLFIRLVERAGADVVAVFVEHADAQGAAIRGVDGGQETAGAYGVHQVRMKIVVLRAVVQQGDEEAFRQLYNEYSDLLYGYGMKIAGDDDLVTESIQSLFVYLYEKRQSCSEPQSISAYLCVALKRMLLNELKKTANGVFTSLDEVNSSEYRFDLEIDIETAIVRSELEREQLEVLQKEINGLTKQQREVLYLKYYKKLNSDEIAEVMGLTSRTVYNTTHMAISRLRERLSKSFLLTVAANLWIFN